ncbi:UNVERIFIED_CONTAM: hypothetical protein FKN15_014090 [Acipenser sinensis]
MDMDVAFLLDSSRTMSSDNFERSKEFLHSVLDQFVITNQPRTSDPGARVALVQHTSSGYTQREEQNPVNLEFDFVAYSSKKQMKRHIKESLHQLQSDSAFGHALEWTINNLFSKVSKARSTKVIFAVIGGDTSFWDKKKLAEIALNAKCQGFTIFTLTIGGPINDTEVEELASFPFSHHSCQLGKVLDLDMDYALKFTHAFFSLVANKINNYPPKILQRKCERLILQQKQQGDEVPMSAPESTATILDPGARVALVQHAYSGYTQREEQNPVNLEFDFVTYSRKKQMKRHIKESLYQLQSDSGVGHAVEWTINNLFSKLSKARSTKVIFAILGGDTSFRDKRKLAEIALNAKCQGFTIFTLTFGGPINDTELEQLASFPFSHHSCQLGKVLDLDMDYALKFTHAFFSLVAKLPQKTSKESERLKFGPLDWVTEQEQWRAEEAPMCGEFGHDREDCPYSDPQYEEAWNQSLVGDVAEWFWTVDQTQLSSTPKREEPEHPQPKPAPVG